MKTTTKSIASNILAIAILFGLILGIAWIVNSFFSYLKEVPKELGAALIAGGSTIIVATATIMIGRYYERKKELDALYREKKTEMYDEALKEFFNIFFRKNSNDSEAPNDDLVLFLQEFTRKLVLWSGPEVIEAFVKWKEHLGKSEPDANSIFLLESFLKSIREDLRHSNKGLQRGFLAKLVLRESDLFLELSANNPKITLATIAEIEEFLKNDRAETSS